MKVRKAILDFSLLLLTIMPILSIILAYYFTIQSLGSVAKEIGRLAMEKVILVQGNCKVAVIRQS